VYNETFGLSFLVSREGNIKPNFAAKELVKTEVPSTVTAHALALQDDIHNLLHLVCTAEGYQHLGSFVFIVIRCVYTRTRPLTCI
jgi:hypothetical protein